MNKMTHSQEWIRQAEYDMGTAQIMLDTGRFVYCVFMCHLSIEKALKGHFVRKLKTNPPKTHDLNYLCERIKIDLPEDKLAFIDELNDLSVPTRYPDELRKILKEYSRKRTQEILKLSKELLLWLKKSR